MVCLIRSSECCDPIEDAGGSAETYLKALAAVGQATYTKGETLGKSYAYKKAIDRVARGYVVDMFDLQLFRYPIFNLADCFVVVGAILGAVYYLFLYEKYDAKKKENGHDAGADGKN